MSIICKLLSAANGTVGFGVMIFGTAASAIPFFLAAIMFQLWSADE